MEISQKTMKELAFGPGIHLKPPANFESKTYTFNLQFNNLSELNSRMKALQVAIDNPKFANMIGDI